jgi:hypothetical protein
MWVALLTEQAGVLAMLLLHVRCQQLRAGAHLCIFDGSSYFQSTVRMVPA